MPLHLAHHKSYHPYNQVNKDRVRRDQAIAAHQDEQQRHSSFAQTDKARLDALHSSRKTPHLDSPASVASDQLPSATTEHPHPPHAHSSASFGYSLLRPQDELNPWYTDPHLRNGREIRKTEDQRLEDAYKDSTVKSSNDPLKAMQSFLSQRKAARRRYPSNISSSSQLPAPIPSARYAPEAVQAARSLRRKRLHRQRFPTIRRN
ncbi:uncharacterized protein MEPE_03649 [Melanopsichium pennsylvanicum]|uniref:CBF1-interacting co-repressor CIR N-terminal domain-containing protein n=2 Tax=Melanopsichium pennsylvanicum TaxID=63383 RepID=A0AAJ4XMH2_9BASI|nr:uncharacterized protein BN887_04544 [Melanopsichium pennsylvanicum 4]SNX84940.1 uncharacterized protein MEPE_03649 [Melanopsichium pennsylvanicum]